MTEKYKESNKYFTVIVLGIIAFLNSDLYFSNVVNNGNQDIIDGINSISKFLLIVIVLFLLTQIPYNKSHKLVIDCISWPVVKILNLVRKNKLSSNTEKTYNYVVAILSNLGYLILLGGFLFYIFLI